MARSTVNRLLMVLSAHLLLNGCGGEPSASNTPPTASAGPDQDVNRGELVALTATATDPDGQSLTLTWTQVAGPSVGALSGPTPTFTAPNAVVTLAFDLEVSDGVDSSPPARVVIRILEDKAHALWVATTGDDANAGTRAAPKHSIQAAIDAANAAGLGADVYVAAGTYPGSLTLRSNVSVYGSYNPTTFLRDVSANATVVDGGTTSVTGAAANALTLDGLTIRSAAATFGGSSIAILLDNSDNVLITGNTISAGAGGAGLGGAPGIGGLQGLDGAAGVPAPANCPDTALGGAGGSGVAFSGGAGGAGTVSAGHAGLSGTGPDSGAAGAGGAASGGPKGSDNGLRGGNGAQGAVAGPVGNSGCSFGPMTGGAYTPADGSGGGAGQGGSSGGGGGGGGGTTVPIPPQRICGGGGGGGGG